ncbi:MAG: hypothetical protein E6G96_04245 [Alphaproteobacteria bacterium]|nr:MAG: hypothetical protein E6G96_04245 [Alphaproteobacteria bacterium]
MGAAATPDCNGPCRSGDQHKRNRNQRDRRAGKPAQVDTQARAVKEFEPIEQDDVAIRDVGRNRSDGPDHRQHVGETVQIKQREDDEQNGHNHACRAQTDRQGAAEDTEEFDCDRNPEDDEADAGARLVIVGVNQRGGTDQYPFQNIYVAALEAQHDRGRKHERQREEPATDRPAAQQQSKQRQRRQLDQHRHRRGMTAVDAELAQH